MLQKNDEYTTQSERLQERHRPTQSQVGALPSAIEDFSLFKDRISSRQPAVFLDFDGTLTPIVPRPDMARLSWAARTVIATLAEKCLVAVVSGRDRLEVKNLVGLPNLIYAGSHGFDVILPDGRVPEHDGMFNYQACLDRIMGVLRHKLAFVQGILIERKRFTIAVHSRNVLPEYISKIENIINLLLKEEKQYIKLTLGKMVYEIQPNINWDKGRSVMWILETLNLTNNRVVPIFFGDDVTDEHAFSRLQNNGFGVVVAEKSNYARLTSADFRVEDADEVITVLRFLQECL